jgi:hypothetical protein
MSPPLRLAYLLTMLSVACGRTGLTRVNLDAGQDLPRNEVQDSLSDADAPPDVAIASDGLSAVDGRRVCGTVQMGPQPWPVLEWVVDTSSSMQAPVSGTGQNGWEVTRDALKQVISGLSSASPAIGLTLFPNRGDCTVAPVAVPAAPITEAAKAALVAALDRVGQPAGGRSTAPAFALAQEDATGTVLSNGLTFGPATVLLLTAGPPEQTPLCGEQQDPFLALETEVRAARARFVPTCVFALPGTGGSRDALIDIAKAGAGVSDVPDASSLWYCFRDGNRGPDSGSFLKTGIECILGGGTVDGDDCIPNYGDFRHGSCVLSIPDLPVDADRDKVTVTMSVGASPTREVLHVDCSSAGADGWDYSSNGRGIIFCGRACDDAQAAWYQSAIFGCQGD